MELTSTLRLWPVKADHAGLYQCVGSNMFGTAYSVRAAITISGKGRPLRVFDSILSSAGVSALENYGRQLPLYYSALNISSFHPFKHLTSS